MSDFRKSALLKTLREEYNITTDKQLLEAIRSMKKLDIAQFVLPPEAERKKEHGYIPNAERAQSSERKAKEGKEEKVYDTPHDCPPYTYNRCSRNSVCGKDSDMCCERTEAV